MKLYKITNFVIVVLVIAAVYQTGELWLQGTTSHNFFYTILQNISQSSEEDQANGEVLLATRYAVGDGGSNFSVYYPDDVGSSALLTIANDTMGEILSGNSGEAVTGEADWKEILQSRCLVLQYDFLLSTEEYLESYRKARSAQALEYFDYITIVPGKVSGEKSSVYFVNSENNEYLLYTSVKSQSAAALYEALQKNEDDMVYISTGQKTTSSVLKRNLFLPQWAQLPYFYATLRQAPVFEQDGAVSRMTLESSVEGFFKNFSADWSTRDEYGNFAFRDSSVVVKYYPGERVLEYYSYETYGTDKNQASLAEGYQISCNFMRNDASLHTDVYLSDIIQQGNEVIYCFDYVAENLPIYLSDTLKEEIGMEHAIEITVRGQAVKKYRRYAVDYVTEDRTAALDVQFIDALDEANRDYQEQVEERIVDNVQNIVLGYYAEDTENIGLKWFVNLYDHLFMIETQKTPPAEVSE